MADKIEASTSQKSGLLSQIAVVAPFSVAHFTHHLITALAVPLTTYIQPEFNLSYAQVGLLITAMSLPMGFRSFRPDGLPISSDGGCSSSWASAASP
jgi:hypothetical protein